MLVIRGRVSIIASLLVVTACGLPDRVRALVGEDVEDAPPSAEVETIEVEPEPREPVTPPSGGLGKTVAELVPQPGAPKLEPGPHGADLDLVDGIHVTRVEAGWTRKPKVPSVGMGVVFEVDVDVKVDPDIGINQARLMAKATCKVGDERRASAAEVYSPNPTPWGGHDIVSADPGEHEHAWALLFMQDNIVGHTPCQLEFRLTSPLSDKPMRVGGTWCVRDNGTEAEACPELPPVAPGDGILVRDWELDRVQQTLELTLQVGERVWLDRELVVRSSCDRGGGERIPRVAFAYGSWGMLDPGDSARVMLSRYDGWFGAEPPCELTIELWRHDDRGNRLDPRTVATACVRKFLPEDGACGVEAAAPSGASEPFTLRTFTPSVSRDPYNRRFKQITADVELLANEDIEGRWNLEVKGHCGKGRRRQEVWLGPDLNVEPRMLELGEVAIGTLRGWMPQSASSCELELVVAPLGAATASPKSLGKYCVSSTGSKAC